MGCQLIDETGSLFQQMGQPSYHKQSQIKSRLAVKTTYLVQLLHNKLPTVEGEKLSSLCFVLYFSSLALLFLHYRFWIATTMSVPKENSHLKKCIIKIKNRVFFLLRLARHSLVAFYEFCLSLCVFKNFI